MDELARSPDDPGEKLRRFFTNPAVKNHLRDRFARELGATRSPLGAGGPLMFKRPEPSHPADKGRLLNLSRDDPQRLYGAGGGPTPLEARRRAGILTPEEVSERLAAEFAGWLDSTKSDPGAKLTISRDTVVLLRSLLGDLVQGQASRLSDLMGRLAYARVILQESPRSRAVKMARALQTILWNMPTPNKRGRRFDAAALARHFQALIETQGTLTLWNSIEAALNLPGRVIEDCPLVPEDAIAVLTGFYGFQSPLACLRCLERERRQREAAYRADPLTLDSILPALRHLPPEGNLRIRRRRQQTRSE
jgi:hypothetical protein